MSLLDQYPQLLPLRGNEDLQRLIANANADEHGVLLPTHAIWKGGDIAGFFAVQSVPFIPCWFSRKTLKARDSMQMINVVNNMVAAAGAQCVAYPVQEHSPFFPHMQHMGFEDHGAFHLFVRKLK